MNSTGAEVNHNCEGGTLFSAFTYATEYYVLLEKDYPYKGYGDQCRTDKISMKGKTNSKFYSFETEEPNDPMAIIRMLKDGPVAASISATSPIFRFYA